VLLLSVPRPPRRSPRPPSCSLRPHSARPRPRSLRLRPRFCSLRLRLHSSLSAPAVSLSAPASAVSLSASASELSLSASYPRYRSSRPHSRPLRLHICSHCSCPRSCSPRPRPRSRSSRLPASSRCSRITCAACRLQNSALRPVRTPPAASAGPVRRVPASHPVRPATVRCPACVRPASALLSALHSWRRSARPPCCALLVPCVRRAHDPPLPPYLTFTTHRPRRALIQLSPRVRAASSPHLARTPAARPVARSPSRPPACAPRVAICAHIIRRFRRESYPSRNAARRGRLSGSTPQARCVALAPRVRRAHHPSPSPPCTPVILPQRSVAFRCPPCARHALDTRRARSLARTLASSLHAPAVSYALRALHPVRAVPAAFATLRPSAARPVLALHSSCFPHVALRPQSGARNTTRCLCGTPASALLPPRALRVVRPSHAHVPPCLSMLRTFYVVRLLPSVVFATDLYLINCTPLCTVHTSCLVEPYDITLLKTANANQAVYFASRRHDN
jgi:hypothetical protein